MKVRWIRPGTLLPVMAAALLGALAPAAMAAGETENGHGAAARVTPPPRPSVPTVVVPGEASETMARHRRAHSHNELKLRGLLRAKEVAPKEPPANGGKK